MQRRSGQQPLPIFSAVERQARTSWIDDARTVVEVLALTQENLTVDDLWRRNLRRPPHGNRAVSALFAWATRNGLLVRTTTPGTWVSLVYDPAHLIPAED